MSPRRGCWSTSAAWAAASGCNRRWAGPWPIILRPATKRRCRCRWCLSRRCRCTRCIAPGWPALSPGTACRTADWLSLLFGHDLFGKPLHTFPDHALEHLEIFAMLPVRDFGLETLDLHLLDVHVIVDEARAERSSEEWIGVERR